MAALNEAKILGVNQRHYPAQASMLGHPPLVIHGVGTFDQTENPPPTVCVLVEGEIGDYAAYVGHGTPEWVAVHGDKIHFDEARFHFIGLERERYRD